MEARMNTFRRPQRFGRSVPPLLTLATGAFLFAAGCAPSVSDGTANTGEVGDRYSQIATVVGNDPKFAPVLQRSLDGIRAARSDLQLSIDHDFRARSVVVDEFGDNHLHFDQTFRGVRVWEGSAIVHADRAGAVRSITADIRSNINLASVTPALPATQARALAHADLRPRGSYVSQPLAELVVYPEMATREKATRLRGPRGELNADDLERVATRHTLAWYVHAELEDGTNETLHTDYIIDATSGSILKKWSTLLTSAATGTGNSQYSSAVQIGTDSTTSGWQLKDVARSMNITTYNLNHGTSGTGTIFTDTDNTWGDGANYTSGGSTTSANGQTAGVDAHYGTEKTFDYYWNVHARNGIDAAGTATYNRVHYSTSYVNAFWSDSCFCMTYGDGGSGYTVLTSLDVAGHEMTHGVTSRTSNLTYSGESGGLNESHSDIHGTMVEFYARGGSGSTIGSTGGNWTIGEQLNATPLRYMYKPSLDGTSPDAWSSSIGSLDVHYSSGPMNRAFYFLSQGSSSSSSSNYYSSYLPGGMTGIGNDAAARISFRALTVKMTASTNYSAARTAYLAAASDLYGTTGAEYCAVQNAFAAINVGTACTGGTDTTPPTTSLTAPTAGATLTGTVTLSATASDNVAVTKVEFYAGTTLLGSDTTSPYSISWASTALANGSYSFTSKAYDAAGNVGTSAAVSATVSNGGTCGSSSQLLGNPGFESGATVWASTSGVINSSSVDAHTGNYSAWIDGYGTTHTDTLSQSVTIPSAACTASLSFWIHITTNETTTTTAYDTLKVQLLNSAGTVLTTLATYSNLNKNTAYAQKTFNVAAYKGQTVTLKFTGTEDSTLATEFDVDDTALNITQ
jgi:Zn-dependent metalloprotease